MSAIEYREDITYHDIGVALVGYVTAMVALRHSSPAGPLEYAEIDDPSSAQGLVRDFIVLATGHSQEYVQAAGCFERLHALGWAHLVEALPLIEAAAA